MRERLAALAVLAASGGYLAFALAFPLGTTARPGPGYFPVVVGVFLCVVAAVFLLASFRRAAGVLITATTDAARIRVGAMAVGLIGFVLLLPWTGYPAVAFGFVALLLKRLGGAGWRTTLVTALASAAGSYYLFAKLLEVPLPRGVFFE